MSEEGKELFDKIDALFEKRAPDALVDKGLEYEDFPVLTEVIVAEAAAPARVEPGWNGVERRGLERRRDERRFGERRQETRRAGERAASNDGTEAAAPRDEVERLVQAMEQSLTELFIRQQLRMEEAVRKAVRDELDKARQMQGDGERDEQRDQPRPL